MKIGFIGAGDMGKTLIESFIHSQTFLPNEIIISNQTPHKSEKLIAQYPSLFVARHNRELVHEVSCCFICVPPHQYRSVLEEIQEAVRPEQIILSVTSLISINDLESWLSGKVAKIIPSITNRIRSGTCLYIPGSRMNEMEKLWLKQLLSTISKPLLTSEAGTQIIFDLISGSPAFIAKFLEQMVGTVVNESELDHETVTTLIQQMTLGTARLLTEGSFTFETLQNYVSSSEGVTGQGLQLLDQELAPTLKKVFQKTNQQRIHDLKKYHRSLMK